VSTKISPLAPPPGREPPAVAGVKLATAEAGIRYKNRTDVLLMTFPPGTEAAGVFTRSRCPSAPVEWCRAVLGEAGAKVRALVVNSGNANAFTGTKGRESTKLTAEIAARAVGCRPDEVLLASTGVIGEPLDATKFEGVLDRLATTGDGTWADAARAIMTTDTFPKAVFRSADLGGAPVTIVGIAKGAGMIAPDMATMLSFVATDAPISAAVLKSLLTEGTEKSFNCLTIDGDTSTSDTLIAFATGTAAGAPRIEDAADPRLHGFRRALEELLIELAQLVARDGEGATRFITVEVTGAESQRSARRVALSIANSPLVKTAVAGADANWGRVVMAVGKAGEPAERDLLSIWFGDIRVAHAGERDPGYDEAAVSAYMRGQEITIRADLGLGRGKATVWTCDFTADYVAINADYRS
jgi:glutamate N-acetyltransferase / amino-acid N-acetyltransferase